MRKATWTVAACVALLWAGTALWVGTARALDHCTVSVRTADGTILVGARNVSGTLLWGISEGTATNAFGNAGTCIAGSPLVAKNCTLGTGAVAITRPPLCRLYLKDASGTCSVFIKTKCTPSKQPRFIDNGDGTVSDTTTGLMWEKKTTDGSVHDVTKGFTWSSGGTAFDGTAKTAFLDKLNDVAGGGLYCFAGYCDWRLPDEEGQNTPGEPKELETIVDTTQGYCGGGTTGACVYPALGPTQWGFSWSATTNAGSEFLAWYVNFYNGVVLSYLKTYPCYVRAVRSGL